MDSKQPNIGEKVKFWEEQDKINNALIPRFLADHNLITSVSQEMMKISSDLTQSILECKELAQKVSSNSNTIASVSQTVAKLSTDIADTRSECKELNRQVIEMNKLLGDLISTQNDKVDSRSNSVRLYILISISILLSIIAMIFSIMH